MLTLFVQPTCTHLLTTRRAKVIANDMTEIWQCYTEIRRHSDPSELHRRGPQVPLTKRRGVVHGMIGCT